MMAAMRVAVILSCLVALAYGGRRELVVSIKHHNLLKRDYQALEFVDKMRLTQKMTSGNMTYRSVQNYVKQLSKTMKSLEDMSDSQKIVSRDHKKLQGDIDRIHKGGMKVTKQLQKLLEKLKSSSGYKKLTAEQRRMLHLMFIPGGGIQLMNVITPDIVSFKAGGMALSAKQLLNNILVKGGVAQYFRGLQKKLHVTDDRKKKLFLPALLVSIMVTVLAEVVSKKVKLKFKLIRYFNLISNRLRKTNYILFP